VASTSERMGNVIEYVVPQERACAWTANLEGRRFTGWSSSAPPLPGATYDDADAAPACGRQPGDRQLLNMMEALQSCLQQICDSYATYTVDFSGEDELLTVSIYRGHTFLGPMFGYPNTVRYSEQHLSGKRNKDLGELLSFWLNHLTRVCGHGTTVAGLFEFDGLKMKGLRSKVKGTLCFKALPATTITRRMPSPSPQLAPPPREIYNNSPEDQPRGMQKQFERHRRRYWPSRRRDRSRSPRRRLS
jgi:hypothetical protein